VVINKNVATDDDFANRYGTTIGNGGLKAQACPVSDNGVELGANAVLLGDITIDNNVMIGAGSVALDSIPDHMLVGKKRRVEVIK
jgi:Serine acetyltransferase